MEKVHLNIFLLFLIVTPALAQQPVAWDYSIKKLSPRIFEIHITASIKKGWHIYSQTQPKDAIASPTKIEINKSSLLLIKGKIVEKGNKELFTNKEVGISAWQYADKVEFVQVVELKAPVKINVNGNVSFQACTEEQCLPPQSVPFSLQIK